MRHRLTTRFVIVVTVLLLAAVLLWSALARTVVDPEAQGRSDQVLSLTGAVNWGPTRP